MSLVEMLPSIQSLPKADKLRLIQILAQELAEQESADGRLEAWKAKLVSSADILGGELVFPGTRLSVRHVGGMRLRGASVNEIQEDYPYLTAEDIELAKLYTEAHPRMDRPRDA